MKKQKLLIGGTPGVGKSYVAKKIAQKKGLPWISTDLVRSIMKKTVNKQEYADLFVYAQTDPEEYFQTRTIADALSDQQKQCEATWKGIEGLIQSTNAWDSYILEGVAILPKFVSESFPNKDTLTTIFIVNSNQEYIERVVYTRGLWTKADEYSNQIKKKEVQWLLLFNEWLIAQAEQYNFTVITNKSGTALLQAVSTFIDGK